MAGIDAGAAEALLVDRLNQKGENIDLLVSHHPSGHALASLHEVMEMQVDMYENIGVPVNVAHALLEERRAFVKRRFGQGFLYKNQFSFFLKSHIFTRENPQLFPDFFGDGYLPFRGYFGNDHKHLN